MVSAVIGSRVSASAAARSTVLKTRALHEAIATIDHPATELVLTRRCADVSRLTYTFRCSGDSLDPDVTSEFDDGLRAALEHILGGPMRDTSWWQATLGVSAAGLGFREAQAVCLPAFIASRITARPLALEMAQHAVDAGLMQLSQFTQAYDDRTRAAFERLQASLPDEMHERLCSIAEEGADDAAQRWALLREGGHPEQDASSSGGRRPGSGLVADAGAEDPENPQHSGGLTGPALQKLFSSIVDECVFAGLQAELTAADQNPDVTRMNEIADPACNHSWLWALCPNHGPTMQNNEFVEAVRLRLGAAGPDEPLPCRLCGAVLDGAGSHPLCCAPGEATRGHNAVKYILHDLARTADPAAELEPLGLIPSHPTLRPADVLTSAATPGRLSAVDVGVTSPEASGAGEDCTEAMRQRKLRYYGQHENELARTNVVYCPAIWSAYGRPHAAGTAIIRGLARRAARRRWQIPAWRRQQQAEAAITLEIWRRAARMLLACWPRHGAEEEDEALGEGMGP